MCIELKMLLLAVSVFVSGCAINYEVPALPDSATAPELYRAPEIEAYRIMVGDRLAIRSFYNPELNQDLLVRPDGRISALLMGDMRVAGLTPSELNRRITRGYNDVLNSTDITVVVTEMPNQRIYVGGEVKNPSVFPLDGSMTMLQAVSAAGGFLSSGDKRQVLLLRKQEDGSISTYKFDTEAVLYNSSPELFLSGNDIIYVPKTGIANAGEFVDQYINQIIPEAVLLNFSFLYDLKRDDNTIRIDDR